MGIFSNDNSSSSVKPMVLIMIDGYGIAPHGESNAISIAKKPNLDSYQKNYIYGELIAAGESVGLPATEAGNSEVGHLTAGVGRVINQSLIRINKSIEDRTFFENPAFIQAYQHTVENNSTFHVLGLVSKGSVHSDIEHFYALIEFCQLRKIENVCYHLITDGRDAPPTSCAEVISEIESRLVSARAGRIASIMGRYYAMDRDARWERTKEAYEAYTLGKGEVEHSASEAINKSYNNGHTDEFVKPTLIVPKGKEPGIVKDGDAVVFFNFRIDRPRQLTMAFTMPEFEKMKESDFGYLPHEQRGMMKKTTETFQREKKVNNLFFVTMTEYQKGLPVSAIAFPPPVIVNSLPEYLSSKGISQCHLAESEKERMVAFYFDGLKEKPYEGEDVVIVSSPDVSTYDKKPEMSAMKIADEFRKAIEKDKYQFFVMNFANPDMVGHTGNLKATVRGIETVDKAIGQVVEETLSRDGTVIITADHGNAEQLLAYNTQHFFFTSEEGKTSTEHTANPVPVFIISKDYQSRSITNVQGSLADVAPTILSIMGMDQPKEMTGKNLLQQVATKTEPASQQST